MGGASSSTRAPASSTTGGKVSKLAALAAARKKQHEKAAGETESVRRAPSSSVDLLSKLGQKSNEASKPEAHPEQQTQVEGGGIGRACNARRYPIRRQKGLEPRVSESESQLEVTALKVLAGAKELKTEDLQAKPSSFAVTMLGGVLGGRTEEKGLATDDVFKLPYATEGFTNFEVFKGPSPDDIVTSAQKKSGKGKTQILWGSLPWRADVL
jgi:hypothetical protein